MATNSTVNIILGARIWTRSLPNAVAVSRRAALSALAVAVPKSAVELSILLASDGAVRKLNAEFRRTDKTTDVLSFPAFADAKARAAAARATPRGTVQYLGDVALAYGVLVREAKAGHKALRAHLSHLVVHGVLHLLGYDHQRHDEAAIMERLEKKILAGLKISDPYALAPGGPPARAAIGKRLLGR
ncbi:MAG: rRNA maturation RNase YbeY [Rhodospirillaceae bacterium]|nr:rRNA maturation RNase YbeY [Rhodospirillaceae bacterium]